MEYSGNLLSFVAATAVLAIAGLFVPGEHLTGFTVGDWVTGASGSVSGTIVTTSSGGWTSIAAPTPSTVYIVQYDRIVSQDQQRNVTFSKSLNGGKSWNTTVVDFVNSSMDGTSVFALNESFIFVSYGNGTNDNLMFANTSNGGSSWSKQAVDIPDDVGYFSSVYAVDKNSIFISYFNNTGGALRFANTSNGGTSWSLQTIDQGGMDTIGKYSSLVALNSSHIYVSYMNQTSGNELKFANTSNGGVSWSLQRVDTQEGAGKYTSLAVINGTTFFIAYQDSTIMAEEALVANSSDGGVTWNIKTVDGTEGAGQYNSIDAVDADNLFISYYVSAALGLRLANSSNGGSNWSYQTVDTMNDPGWYSDVVAIDAQTAYMSYFEQTNDDLLFAKVVESTVTDCRAIQAGGNYTLGNDVSNDTTCFWLKSDDIDLNCNGQTISYGDAGQGQGIVVSNRANVTIRNCVIKDVNETEATGIGINLTGVSGSLIANTSIFTNGTTNNYGIYVSASGNSTVLNTTINTQGTGAFNYGIYAHSGISRFSMNGNYITTNGTTSNHGIYISVNSTNNTISNNSVNSRGSDGSYGIYIDQASNANNLFGNNITTDSNDHYAIYIAGTNLTIFNNTLLFRPREWVYLDNGTVNSSFDNTTFWSGNGSLTFTDSLLANGTINITHQKLNTTTNNVSLNTTNLEFLNTTSIINLFGIVFGDPEPTFDTDGSGYSSCTLSTGPACEELSFVGNIFAFNVTHFTSFAAGRDSTIPTVNVTYPINDSIFGVNFNISENITEANLDHVIYNVSNSSGNVTQWLNQTNQSGSGQWTSLINISALADGNYTITKLAFDDVGNEGIAQLHFRVDQTAPIISGEAVVSITTSSAVLEVSTNEDANCRADTADASYDAMTISFDSTGGQSHSTGVSGLGSGTSYGYYVACQDSLGNSVSGVSISFTTIRPGGSSGGSGGGGGSVSSSTSKKVAPISAVKQSKVNEQAPVRVEQPVEKTDVIPPSSPKILPLSTLPVARTPLASSFKSSRPENSEVVMSALRIAGTDNYRSLFIGDTQDIEISIPTEAGGQVVKAKLTKISSEEFAVSAIKQNDNGFDIYLSLHLAEDESLASNSLDNSPLDTTFTTAAVSLLSRKPDVTVELEIQKSASPEYKPSLGLLGFFEAFFRGPKSSYFELFGPFEDDVSIGQRYTTGITGQHRIEFDMVRGSELMATQQHEIILE
jgi:hypothetical protein